MKLEQIKNISSLLNLRPNQKVLGYKIKPLTAPGENYGSLMLNAQISLESDELNVVIKMVPPSEFLRELFNIQVTFRNEVAFYKNIVPLLQNFQREHGVENVIDFFPEYYGSRLNLIGDEKVDLDAALVLENLKIKNYITMERTEGLGLDVAKLIIKDLAYFHAVPLALRLQKPDVFDKEIKPYLSTWLPLEDGHSNMKAQLDIIINQVEEVSKFRDRILKGFDMEMVPHDPGDLFATLTHNDCWTNNNMIKFEGNKPVKNKLVDYQVCDYGSPARDVVFFIFSSVKSDIIEKYYDSLVLLYHDTFISVLTELCCDIEPFTLTALKKELDFEARNSEFAHVMFMLFVMFAPKQSAKEMSEVTPESMVASEITDLFKQRLIFVVNEFVKRDWI
ncbi:hypothetical protein Zmor_010119 [Zophobas morio]|uniref:CHK kinase-like domain-containing protein n=1 Tax=Zophobas morio TaxID=2755281 RepID=A0AA38IRV6_9CUCU|nr:hypothetical protein Zmor_010119 [Zophobas morio]